MDDPFALVGEFVLLRRWQTSVLAIDEKTFVVTLQLLHPRHGAIAFVLTPAAVLQIIGGLENAAEMREQPPQMVMETRQ